MKRTNKEVSELFSRGNFSACYDQFADDIEWKIIGGKTLKSKEETVSYCDQMAGEMSTSSFKNTNIIIGDNDIAIEGICSFTDADNKPEQVAYCDIFHLENEKISKITSYCI